MILDPSPIPPDQSWIDSFHAFTPFHYAVLAICIGSFIAFCVTGKKLLAHDRLHGTHHEEKFRRVLAWTIIVSQSFFFIRRLTPGHWDLQDSLPMHLCRWTVWIAAWSMLSLNPKMRALLLFWGLGLSTQAFFTPMITYGAKDIAFWIYWINHTQIVGAAIYDLVVLGYRPTKRDLKFAMLWGLVYALLTIGLNLALSTNYSYLGVGEHEGTSVVDQLGPFPQRLIWMVLGGQLIFVFIYLVSISMRWVRTRVLKKPMPLMVVASTR